MSARIRIAAESDTRSMSRVDPGGRRVFERARDPIRQAARRARWVLTQYPTPAYAADARMPLAEYEEFVTRAMFLDRARPARPPGKSWAPPGGPGGIHVGRASRSASRPTGPT